MTVGIPDSSPRSTVKLGGSVAPDLDAIKSHRTGSPPSPPQLLQAMQRVQSSHQGEPVACHVTVSSHVFTDRVAQSKVQNFRMKDKLLGLEQPYHDLAWINLMFEFQTDVGNASSPTDGGSVGSGRLHCIPIWRASKGFRREWVN